MLALLSALGIDPNADPDDQIEQARELAEAACRLPRVYAERDEALQAVRRLDDEGARLRAQVAQLQTRLDRFEDGRDILCDDCGRLAASVEGERVVCPRCPVDWEAR